MKIICVFKTHFDIGYTDLAENVVKRYGGQMLSDVLDACEKSATNPPNKRFVWTMAAWPMLRSLEVCSEENRIRAEKCIANGQLVVHALPYTLHTESLGRGDMAHLFDSAEEFCRRFGRPFPLSAKMTDVPGHTVALVAPLAERGVKFLHLGCNPASTPPRVPTMFWWEDDRGNRVLTFYNNTYGSTVVPPKDWPFPVWLSLCQTNDNMGPQSVEILEEIERTAKSAIPDAEVVFGTMDDFYNEISKCDLSGLPVIKKDLGDTWIHGVGTYPKEVGLIRRARAVAEKAPLQSDERREFYENSLLFSEHTWGMDIKTFLTWQRSYEKEKFLQERTLPRYQLVEESWNEQRRRAEKCAEIASRYAPLYGEFPKSLTENDRYIIYMDGARPVIRNKITGRTVTVGYTYEIVGTQKMTEFMRRYLTRFYAWALSDFGRDNYGEVEDRRFGIRLARTSVTESGVEAEYITPRESTEKFGNAERIKFTIGIVGNKVLCRVNLYGKQASPYIEAGHAVFTTNSRGDKYGIRKIDKDLDPATDIEYNANNILYCISDRASIDDVAIDPIDSPLVSFGKSAIYRFNGGKFKRPAKPAMYFNLFNNMWGTNFPQWTEGDFVFDFYIED